MRLLALIGLLSIAPSALASNATAQLDRAGWALNDARTWREIVSERLGEMREERSVAKLRVRTAELQRHVATLTEDHHAAEVARQRLDAAARTLADAEWNLEEGRHELRIARASLQLARLRVREADVRLALEQLQPNKPNTMVALERARRRTATAEAALAQLS